MPQDMSTFIGRLESVLAGRAPGGDSVGRPSAVMLVLFARQNIPHLLLTKRAGHLHHHPGQISLPGGRPEPQDSDLLATALRETEEEVGVPPDALRVIGRLDDVNTVASDFLMTPWVAVASPLPVLRPDPSEIARILTVPVRDLVEANAALPDRPGVRTLRYPLDGEDVWGATARVLRCFCALLDATASG